LDISFHGLEGYLDFSDFVNLRELNFSANRFTSVDFLNTLPNPEQLEELRINCNNIQPIDIAFFSKFVNLKCLKIGNTKGILQKGQRNKFYGSFRS